jgi:cardiolipin synthase
LAGYALAACAACHALLHKTDPQSALAWVAFIVLVPYVGTAAYLFFGVSRVNSRAAFLLARASQELLEPDDGPDAVRERQPARVPQAPPDESPPPAHMVVALVGQNLTRRGLMGGNRLTLLRNGEAAYPRMLEAIRNAAGHAYLSTYIFRNDESGRAFAGALADAARRGADTRLIVDGLGASPYTKGGLWRRLEKNGVKVRHFLPPRLIPPNFSLNLRTHRKLLVCDGRVGFIGGMNIGDQHLAESPGKGRVQDIHFRCEGPVAAMLGEAFLTDWAFLTHSRDFPAASVPEPCGDSRCRLIFDGLGKGRNDILRLLCGVIGGARKSVRIMTPYFLPPRELSSALGSAALRGVEVSVVLPEVNNVSLVHRASRHARPRLAREGVRIFFQPPPFAHTKLLLVDDYYALVGSANLDPRSLFLNFELNMEIFDRAFCSTLQAYFNEVLARSREGEEEPRGRALMPRLLDAAVWLFSPYL